MELRDEDYLGDGVHVGHDGWHIWLTVEREGRLERVALEPPVFAALVTYERRLREKYNIEKGEEK